MNPAFKAIGVGVGKHSGYEYLCVMDYAGGFHKKGEKP